MSRRLNFSYDISLELQEPVTRHAFALRCIPRSFAGQQVLDVSLALNPENHYAIQEDGFGNYVEYGRIEAPHTHFHYGVRGSAVIDCAARQPEAAHPMYRYPSAYTQPDRAAADFVNHLWLPRHAEDCAKELAEIVHDQMQYVPGVTAISTKAAAAFAGRSGVCQDFAHVYLMFARLAGLTARYANGLTEGEGESHAWCEVWLDGIWRGIDPTRNQWADDSYLRLNVGRDYADCPIERGVFSGCTVQTQSAFAQVK